MMAIATDASSTRRIDSSSDPAPATKASEESTPHSGWKPFVNVVPSTLKPTPLATFRATVMT
jgi:hypothetical protein